jgi:uncharacterized membrane protein
MSRVTPPATDERAALDAQPVDRSTRRLTELYRAIVRVLNGGFLLSIGLILFGLAVAIVRLQQIDSQSDPLRDVLPAAVRLDPQAIIELGILTMIATPVAYVVVSLVTFIRQRDAFFVAVCTVLLAIIGGSIGIALR